MWGGRRLGVSLLAENLRKHKAQEVGGGMYGDFWGPGVGGMRPWC